MSSRASAMAAAGMVLSHPTMQITASNNCPRQTSSMESAITSRLTSEARMPSVPMVSPSLMAMVLNSMGVPPAARTPSFTFTASRRRWKLHGMVSIQVLAIPISGLFRSSLVKPIALNMERAPARDRPSVMRRLRCFGSIGLKDYDRAEERERRGPWFWPRQTGAALSCVVSNLDAKRFQEFEVLLVDFELGIAGQRGYQRSLVAALFAGTAYPDGGFEHQKNVVAAVFDPGNNFSNLVGVRQRFIDGLAQFFHQLLQLLIHESPLAKTSDVLDAPQRRRIQHRGYF